MNGSALALAAYGGGPVSAYGSDVPVAAEYPRSSFVLSTSGTDRTALRWSVVVLGTSIFAIGFGMGWLVGKSSRK